MIALFSVAYARLGIGGTGRLYFAIRQSMGTSLDVVVQLRGLTACLQCFDAVGWAAGRAPGL